MDQFIRAIGPWTESIIDLLEAEGAKFINYMIEGAQRLEALIAGLREFWQLSEQVAEPPTLVDCDQVLKAVLLNLETMIADSGAVITADLLPSIMASETPLLQLFQNLIGNAIKYRSQAPPIIHISSAERSAEYRAKSDTLPGKQSTKRERLSSPHSPQ